VIDSTLIGLVHESWKFNTPLAITPISHPFIERLIGTIRREYLDQMLFWNTIDLERKLGDFQAYYNQHRTHSSLDGDMPAEVARDRRD